MAHSGHFTCNWYCVLSGIFSDSEDKALQQSTTKMTAEQILDQRYAKGEITREEYQQKKNDLEQGR